ncbi:MAG: sugar phosphate isomerase/epimerase [Planctomycetes bacterium]|nr:sugar phosphate isomerase/epimerase [Planctomycetota bacterium]
MKLCLFSVSYAGLWGQERLGLDEFLRHAAKLGYQAVMLAGKRPHLSPLDASPERIAQVRDLLKELKLECAVMGAYTDFAGGSAAEVPYLEMQIGYVESLARIGRQLGAGIVRIFTSYESATTPFTLLWDRTVKAIQECCDRAAAHQCTIAIQNHHDIGVHTDALLEFLNDVNRPNCKLGYDAWSPALRGEELYTAARALAPHTACTTNADYVKLPRFQYQPALVNYLPALPDAVRAVPFGTGFIDYAAFFNGLRDGGFDGIATYEMCSPVRGGGARENLDHYATTYFKWLR